MHSFLFEFTLRQNSVLLFRKLLVFEHIREFAFFTVWSSYKNISSARCAPAADVGKGAAIFRAIIYYKNQKNSMV
jgi:hypothetical protein